MHRIGNAEAATQKFTSAEYNNTDIRRVTWSTSTHFYTTFSYSILLQHSSASRACLLELISPRCELSCPSPCRYMTTPTESSST